MIVSSRASKKLGVSVGDTLLDQKITGIFNNTQKFIPDIIVDKLNDVNSVHVVS